MHFGVGKGRQGTVIFLTLGTGVGSGVFNDGVLVPNTEFGQMEIRGRAAEKRSAAIARVRRGLSWKAWAADLDEHLDRIQQLMWPNLMILGGGVSKSAEKFIPRLTVKCEVVAGRAAQRCGDHRGSHRRGRKPRRRRRRRIDHARTSPESHPRGEDMTTDKQATLERSSDEAPIRAQMVIGGESVDAADGQTSTSSTRRRGRYRDRATRRAGRRRPGGRGGPARVRRSQGLGDLGGRQARPDAGQVRLADQGQHRGAGPAREPERRQADHRRARRDHRGEPRLRLLRRSRQQDLRADDPGLEAGPRPDAARADRGGRADRALELPAVDGIVEGGARAGRREHGDPQARQLLPVDGDPPRRAGTRGGDPGRRAQCRDRAGRLGRCGDRGASGHRQGRLHRRDHDRPGDHAAGRGQREEDLARARWQEPEHRLRRRGPREVRARIAVFGLRQRGPGLLRAEPDPRRTVGPRPGRRAVRRGDTERQARRPVARRDRGRVAGQLQAARPGQGLHRDRAGRGRDAGRRRRRPRRTRRWPTAPT